MKKKRSSVSADRHPSVARAKATATPLSARPPAAYWWAFAAAGLVGLVLLSAWLGQHHAVPPRPGARVPKASPPLPFGTGWPSFPKAPAPNYGPQLIAVLPKYDGPLRAKLQTQSGAIDRQGQLYAALRLRIDQALALAGEENVYAKEVVNDLAFEGIRIDFSFALPENAGANFAVQLQADGYEQPVLTVNVESILKKIEVTNLIGVLRHELTHYHQWRATTDPVLRATFFGEMGMDVAKTCAFIFESELQAYTRESEVEIANGYPTDLSKVATSDRHLRRWLLEYVGKHFLTTNPLCLVPWAKAAGHPQPERLLPPPAPK